MNYLVAESCRHRERSTVDQGSRGCRRESTCVANSATDTGEKRITCVGCRRDRVLTTWCTCCRHEVGEGKHVAAVVLRILDRIKGRRERHVDHTFRSARRVLVRSGVRGIGRATAKAVELAGDTHLVEISIACERKQAGLLRLPTKTADTQCIAGFGYGNGSQCSTLSDWLCCDVV